MIHGPVVMAGSFVVDELAPGLNTGGFFHFLPLCMPGSNFFSMAA
jgi:hypothetical protein